MICRKCSGNWPAVRFGVRRAGLRALVAAMSSASVAPVSLSFQDIVSRLAHWPFPERLDGVVGIAQGGVVPAALVAQRLGLDLKVIALNYRDEANEPRFPEPRLLAPVPALGGWRRVLLVDDVYVSGRSWRAARALLPPEIDVLAFVLKGRVDFALIRDIDGCVRWPWRPG